MDATVLSVPIKRLLLRQASRSIRYRARITSSTAPVNICDSNEHAFLADAKNTTLKGAHWLHKEHTTRARARTHTYAHVYVSVPVYVSQLQLLTGAEHTAFGDGDACRSNGCAPPGPTTKPASSGHGIGVSPPLLPSTKEKAPKKGGGEEGRTKGPRLLEFRQPPRLSGGPIDAVRARTHA